MRWLDGNTDSMDMLLLLIASVTSGSVQPHRRQPTRLPRPWDSPYKNTGVGCHFLLQSMDMSLSKFWEIVKDREAWHAAVHGGHKESDKSK